MRLNLKIAMMRNSLRGQICNAPNLTTHIHGDKNFADWLMGFAWEG